MMAITRLFLTLTLALLFASPASWLRRNGSRSSSNTIARATRSALLKSLSEATT